MCEVSGEASVKQSRAGGWTRVLVLGAGAPELRLAQTDARFTRDGEYCQQTLSWKSAGSPFQALFERFRASKLLIARPGGTVGVREGHVSALCHSCLEPTPALNHVFFDAPRQQRGRTDGRSATCRRRPVRQWLSIMRSRGYGRDRLGLRGAPRTSTFVDMTNGFSRPLSTGPRTR